VHDSIEHVSRRRLHPPVAAILRPLRSVENRRLLRGTDVTDSEQALSIALLWRFLSEIFKLFFKSSKSSLQNVPVLFDLAQVILPSRTDKAPSSRIRIEIFIWIPAPVRMIMTGGHSNSLLCVTVYSKIVDEMESRRSHANEESAW